jgi:hypothetical protein
MMKHTRGVAASSALVAAAAVAFAVTGAGAAAAHPAAGGLDPSNFTHPQGNAYFPLTPGLVLHYRGTDDGQHLRERVRVTHKTKRIAGVRAQVVNDVLRRSDGTVAEATKDWYADDNAGNVWYVGENTATYSRTGKVRSREGSWEAGVKGAVAGLIMPANPHPTDAYRQEFWAGHAEDQGWIVQRTAKVHVPAGTYRHVVRSYEWSRLEKKNVSLKFYAKGAGVITEHDVAGGSEKFWLVKIDRP